MEERRADLCVITEPWEVEDKKEHSNELQKLMNEKGIKYLSTCRLKEKRGGGAALAVRLERFSLTKCKVIVPKGIECVWGIIRPKFPSKICSQIICAAFYSPPKCGRNIPSIEHMMTTLQILLSKFPS